MSATEGSGARAGFAQFRRVVVKIGSALLTADGRGLNREGIAHWVAQMATLKQGGAEIVIVSSGAVAEGMARLGWKARPKAVHFVTLLPKTRSGKLLRRSIQALAESRDPGDLTTIEDPSALEQIRTAITAPRA